MGFSPYPDHNRALRQLDRHVPGCLRDPHAYEPAVRPLADWLAEQDAERARVRDEERPVSARDELWNSLGIDPDRISRVEFELYMDVYDYSLARRADSQPPVS